MYTKVLLGAKVQQLLLLIEDFSRCEQRIIRHLLLMWSIPKEKGKKWSFDVFFPYPSSQERSSIRVNDRARAVLVPHCIAFHVSFWIENCPVGTYRYDSATSSALPISPVGSFCLRVAMNSSSCSFGMPSHKGVSTAPGLIKFTLMGAFECQHIHGAICPTVSPGCVFTSGIAHLSRAPSCALYHASLYASSVTSLSMSRKACQGTSGHTRCIACNNTPILLRSLTHASRREDDRRGRTIIEVFPGVFGE